jgi:LysM repeat protein
MSTQTITRIDSEVQAVQRMAAEARPIATIPANPAPAPLDSSSPSSSRLRITRRGRVVLAVVTAAVVAAVVGAVLLVGGEAVASQAGDPTDLAYVQVESGQSLWQIAEDVAPERDPRDVVSEIVRLNGLPGADVQAGQQLAIPAGW